MPKQPKSKSVEKPKSVEPRKMRILIVEDHPIFRQGLVQMITREADLMVCGETEDGRMALEQIKTTKPDLAIVDISLKGSNGIELLKDIRVHYPELQVLILSMHDEALYAERVLRAGAKGYIMKQEAPEKIMDAIRKLQKGDFFVSESVTKHMFNAYTGKAHSAGVSPLERLSDRELEVFHLLGEGQGTSEIARKLRLSVKTVESYRQHIKEKLNLKNAMALVRAAVSYQAIDQGNSPHSS